MLKKDLNIVLILLLSISIVYLVMVGNDKISYYYYSNQEVQSYYNYLIKYDTNNNTVPVLTKHNNKYLDYELDTIEKERLNYILESFNYNKMGVNIIIFRITDCHWYNIMEENCELASYHSPNKIIINNVKDYYKEDLNKIICHELRHAYEYITYGSFKIGMFLASSIYNNSGEGYGHFYELTYNKTGWREEMCYK